MKTNEPKRCPFCGSSKIFVHVIFHKDRTAYKWSGEVMCTCCLASIVTGSFEDNERDAKIMALDKWNYRVKQEIE